VSSLGERLPTVSSVPGVGSDDDNEEDEAGDGTDEDNDNGAAVEPTGITRGSVDIDDIFFSMSSSHWKKGHKTVVVWWRRCHRVVAKLPPTCW